MSIYELHLGSWRRGDDNRLPSYKDIALELAGYVRDLGFTHVELMPLTEHPFYGSWGYQTTGYFAPTSRYGAPQDLMYLIEVLHQHDIGVILDWVPSHFPAARTGSVFDGTHLTTCRPGQVSPGVEQLDLQLQPQRSAVVLLSSVFWLDKYHIDGLRVDAVASSLSRLRPQDGNGYRIAMADAKICRRSISCVCSTIGLSRLPDVRSSPRVDVVADGFRPVSMGGRLRHEMEHGLDATRSITCARSRSIAGTITTG
jgi:1,4-alpha-glucan branching enzyme